MVRVDLNDKEKYNKPETWPILLQEDSKDVLEWAAALKGDVMMVCYLQNARHVIQHRSLGTGDLVSAAPSKQRAQAWGRAMNMTKGPPNHTFWERRETELPSAGDRGWRLRDYERPWPAI